MVVPGTMLFGVGFLPWSADNVAGKGIGTSRFFFARVPVAFLPFNVLPGLGSPRNDQEMTGGWVDGLPSCQSKRAPLPSAAPPGC